MQVETQQQIAVSELQPIAKRTSAYAGTIEALEIHDDEQLGMAGDLKKDLAHYRRKLEDKRKSLVDPLNKVVKDINAMFKAPRDRIDALTGQLSSKMNGYVKRQEQLERQRRLEEQREAEEREKRLREAAEQTRAETGGEENEIGDIFERQADETREAAAKLEKQRSAPTRGDKATVSTVKKWTGTVVDVKAACLAIAEGRLPADLVSFSQSDLNGLARALEREETRDGIKYEQVVTAGVR